MSMRVRILTLAAVLAATASACAVPSPVGGTAGGGPAANAGPRVGGCQVMPRDNPWNQDVSALPVRGDSQRFIASINASQRTLHADFGTNPDYGIPYVVVSKSQPLRTIHYTAYGDESDKGPFPIPPTAPVEGGARSTGDRHVLVVQQGTCRLFELYRAFWRTNRWDADAGAAWNLSSNALRPRGRTSADAAGLPILPGLARIDEVKAGHIDHALRFTVSSSQRGYILPATHAASSSTNVSLPPMGLRLRLKASFDLRRYHGQSRVILDALRRYGMIVADNGSSWFVSGTSDRGWNDDDLNQLKTVPGSAFEAVDTGPIRH